MCTEKFKAEVHGNKCKKYVAKIAQENIQPYMYVTM